MLLTCKTGLYRQGCDFYVEKIGKNRSTVKNANVYTVPTPKKQVVLLNMVDYFWIVYFVLVCNVLKLVERDTGKFLSLLLNFSNNSAKLFSFLEVMAHFFTENQPGYFPTFDRLRF